MYFIELSTILFIVGIAVSACFLVLSVSLKHYPVKYFPKLAKKILYVINSLITINNLLFYGLWAIICSAFIIYSFSKSTYIINDIISFGFLFLGFFTFLIGFEYIRLRGKSVKEVVKIKNLFYMMYSIALFFTILIKPNLLPIFIHF